MFGIGIGELLLIAIVALVLVGPKKLPDLMRQGGKFFVQLRRTANDVKATFDDVIREAENELRQQELAQLRDVLNKQDHELKSIDVTSKDSAQDRQDQWVPRGAVDMSNHDPLHDPHHQAEVSSHQGLNSHHASEGSETAPHELEPSHPASRAREQGQEASTHIEGRLPTQEAKSDEIKKK